MTSVFRNYVTDKESKPVFLQAKKAKINAGVPIAAVHKQVQLKNSVINYQDIIPPIATRPLSSENIVEIEKQKDQVLVAENGQHKSLFKFLEFVKENPESNEFAYLIPAAFNGKSQAVYNPYNLKIVDFFEINLKSSEGYYTISAKVFKN